MKKQPTPEERDIALAKDIMVDHPDKANKLAKANRAEYRRLRDVAIKHGIVKIDLKIDR